MMSFASIADPSNTSSRDLFALSQPLTSSGMTVVRLAVIQVARLLGSRQKNGVMKVADTDSFMMVSSQCPDTGIQET